MNFSFVVRHPIFGLGALVVAALFVMACVDGGSQEGAQVTATKTEEEVSEPRDVVEAPVVASQEQPLETAPIDEREVQAAVAEISIEDYHTIVQSRGGRPLFVNFWATFCVPCKTEMPGIVELYEKYGEDRMDFLAVSADYFSNTVEEVPAVMRELGMTLPTRILVTRNASDAIESIDPDWSGVLPTTFLYDGEGNMVIRFFEEKTKEEFEEAILAVLDGESGA